MQHKTHAALREPMTARPVARHASASPHVLDLAPTAAPQDAARTKIPRGLAYLRHLLNHRIHLRDLRVRRVSTHLVDWRDFPPRHAAGLRHASFLTLKRFLNEHPLADLTIVTVLHIAGLIIWKSVTGLRPRTSVGVAAPTLLPVVKVMPRDAAHVRTTPKREMPRLTLPNIRFTLSNGWLKNAAGAAAAVALFVLPIGAYGMLGGLRTEKDHIIDDGMRAVAMIHAAVSAAEARDFTAASDALHAAAGDFAAARARLGALGGIMNAASSVLPLNAAVTSPAPLLIAGEEAAAGGAELAAALAAVHDAPTPMEKFRVVRDAAARALPHLTRASDAVSRVSDGILPPEHREKLSLAKRELPRFTAMLAGAVGATDALEMLLGGAGERRYLVLFQNNSELRPTGGFIGSFALIDVKDGEITAMEVPGGGSYDLQGSLSLNLIAPQPLRLINPKWEFQDANWYPDFPSSAAQLSRFYEKSGGPTVDGVIAVNATFVEDLLEATGPIALPEFGKTITAQNFFFETQKQVEIDYDKAENKPKAIIGALAPLMLERLAAADEKVALALASTVAEGLGSRELQFWFRDAELQTRLTDAGWDGAFRAADGDFLSVVHTNIAGQKTDLAMRENITHAAQLMTDGSAVVHLTVARTHEGQPGALFSGVRNVDYLRVYVPAGAELVDASGFEQPDPALFDLAEEGAVPDPVIAAQEQDMHSDRATGTRTYMEHGMTVFGNWVQTDPGETSVVTLTYRLPSGVVRMEDVRGLDALYARVTGEERQALRYTLDVRRQSGTVPAEFTSIVDLPRGFVATAADPWRDRDAHDRLLVERELRKDLRFDLTAETP